MEALLEYVTVLHSTNSSFAIFKELLKKLHPTGPKIHDYEIASIGLDRGIDTIATYNERDFKEISGIQILVPPPSESEDADTVWQTHSLFSKRKFLNSYGFSQDKFGLAL